MKILPENDSDEESDNNLITCLDQEENSNTKEARVLKVSMKEVITESMRKEGADRLWTGESNEGLWKEFSDEIEVDEGSDDILLREENNNRVQKEEENNNNTRKDGWDEKGRQEVSDNRLLRDESENREETDNQKAQSKIIVEEIGEISLPTNEKNLMSVQSVTKDMLLKQVWKDILMFIILKD